METKGNISALFDGKPFEPSSIDNPATGDQFDSIPPGWYPVQIDDVEVGLTSSGTGNKVSITMTVLESPNKHAGRKLFDILNIINPCITTQDIARRRFSALGLACDIPLIDDTNQILGKKVLARCKAEEKDGYKNNPILGYKHINEYHSVIGASEAQSSPKTPSEPIQQSNVQQSAQTTQEVPEEAQAPQNQNQENIEASASDMPWMR